ncbi:MAG TPA: hypothetical protein VFI70_10255 [Nitrososphaeraceae archaeon]|nr:hypothetical protein [Nitrososphaeraceae archaeon]
MTVINWIYKNTDGSNKWTATDNGKKWVEKILQITRKDREHVVVSHASEWE